MKKTVILALVAGAVLVSGCDFFRSLAGRPTSEEIAAKRDSLAVVAAEREAAEAQALALAQHRADSLAAVAQFRRDSLATEEEIAAMKVMVLTPDKLKGLYHTTLDKKYYVVIGSFRERANAEKKRQQAVSAGYTAEVIGFCNGYVAVGAAATDSVTVILPALKQLRQEQFCPRDAWILLNP